MHGLLLLDKAVGLSSNAAMQKVRRLFDADKAGHGGTLDPLASGLLPVLFGEACKLAASALEGDKAYEAVVRLGITTSTDDAEGEILTEAPVALPGLDERIAAVLPRFRGRIRQVPPIYSALKVNGKALYRHAREGAPVVPEARDVTIHGLEVLGRDGVDLRLSVACSKGTYIRSLARDLGAALGSGAHLAGLRRTVVGRFDIAEAFTLDALTAMADGERQRRLVGLDSLVADWPQVALDAAGVERFRQGQTVPLALAADGPADPSGDDRVSVHGPDGLVGLGLRKPAAAAGRWVVSPTRVIH